MPLIARFASPVRGYAISAIAHLRPLIRVLRNAVIWSTSASRFSLALRIGMVLVLLAGLVAAVVYSIAAAHVEDVAINWIADFTFAPIAVVIAYSYFRWGRGWQVHRFYQRLAKFSPQALLPGATENLRRIERDALYRELHAEIMANPAGTPHVVLGPAGAGKTTALQGLVSHLADHGLTPVVIRQYTYEGVADLAGLLRQSFMSVVDRRLHTDSQGDALWRGVLRSDGVVAIIDGMDDWRARQGIGPSDALYMISRSAEAAGIRTVVAMRSDRRVLDEPYPAFPLDALDVSATEVSIRCDELPIPLEPSDRQAYESALTAVKAGSAPLFLELATQSIYDTDLLRRVESLPMFEARAELFNGWLGLQVASTRRRSGDLSVTLEDDLLRLELLAARLSRSGRLDISNSELESPSPAEQGGFTRAQIASAQRLGQYLKILDISAGPWPEQRVAFNHSIMQSMMTARSLSRSLQDAATQAHPDLSQEMRHALMYVFNQTAHSDARHELQRRLLANASAASTPESQVTFLSLLVTLGSPPTDLVAQIVSRCQHLFSSAPDNVQLRVIDIIAALPGVDRYRCLWEWSIEGQLAVGIKAGRAMMLGGNDSFDLLRSEIVRLIDEGSTMKLHEALYPDWGAFGGKVTMLSVLLPVWADICSGAAANELHALTAKLVSVAAQGQIGGVEASIMAGFYGAIRRNPDSASRTHLPELARHLQTHDARLDLVQVASLLLQHDLRSEEARSLLRTLDSPHEHPLVQGAARIARQALHRHLQLDRVVWNGGEQAVPKSGARLTGPAHAVLADSHLLAMLENQYNTGSVAERDRRDRAWEARTLPPCLSESPTRDELFSGCSTDCAWKLCPLDLRFVARSGSVPFSPAFLRHEARSSSHTRRTWNNGFIGPGASAFWKRLDAAFAVARSRFDA